MKKKIVLLAIFIVFMFSYASAESFKNITADELNKDSASVTKNKQGLRKNSDIQVVMYMTDWCPYCKKAGKYIKSLGVHLTQYNIEKDENSKNKMKSLSGGSSMVPLIDIEGVIIRGYVPEEIRDAVEKKKKSG